jgi:hypothetical protein
MHRMNRWGCAPRALFIPSYVWCLCIYMGGAFDFPKELYIEICREFFQHSYWRGRGMMMGNKTFEF